MNDALDEIIPDPMEVAARVLYNNAEGDYENAQFYLAEMRSLSPAARRAYLKRRMRKMGALCDALNTILMGKINAKAADSSPEGRPPHPPRTG